MAEDRFSVETTSWAVTLLRPLALSIIIAGIVLGLPDTSRGDRGHTRGQSATTKSSIHQDRTPTVRMAAKEKSGETSSSREGRTTNKRNVERWKALPSDEKKELRNRMDQWRNLSPQEQDTYRRRYEKLQEMTPGQRKKIDQGLEKWDTLPPAEKEAIRQQFEE